MTVVLEFIRKNLNLTTGLILALVLSLGMNYYFYSKNVELKDKNITSEALRLSEYAVYEAERSKAKMVIESQNKQIEQFAIDAANYETFINDTWTLLKGDKERIQKQIEEALEKDPSVNNQYNIVEELLREFEESE